MLENKEKSLADYANYEDDVEEVTPEEVDMEDEAVMAPGVAEEVHDEDDNEDHDA